MEIALMESNKMEPLLFRERALVFSLVVLLKPNQTVDGKLKIIRQLSLKIIKNRNSDLLGGSPVFDPFIYHRLFPTCTVSLFILHR